MQLGNNIISKSCGKCVGRKVDCNITIECFEMRQSRQHLRGIEQFHWVIIIISRQVGGAGMREART